MADDNDGTSAAVAKEVARASSGSIGDEEIKELVQLVIFELDEEEYGVEISELREILRRPEVTPIPNSPDFIEGIINVRGQIVVVMDLEKRFNLVRDSKGKSLHVILTEIGESTFGAVVDEVTEVIRVPKDSIEAAPAIISEKISADYVKGIAVLEDRLIILLDVEKVFDEQGLTELGAIVSKQAQVAQSRQTQEAPEDRETEAERKARVEKLVEERIVKGKKEEKKSAEPSPPRPRTKPLKPKKVKGKEDRSFFNDK